MNCRIIYKDNKIDHVQAENGERSNLFDSLKDIFGAEKALELYALTEEDGYKQKIQEKVRSFVGVTEKQIDKLSEVIDAQETLNKLVETGLADNVYQMTSEEIEAKLVELGVEADVAKQVVAYHGSPYSFDRFTTNSMGTGEGAQAFGWGLYFTDLESIARNYAKNLSTVKFKGQDISQIEFFDLLFTGLDASNSDFYDYQNGRIHNLKEFKKYVDDNVNYLSNLTVVENSPSIQRMLSDYEYREEKIKQAKENIKATKDTDFKTLQDNLVKAGLDVKTAKNIADDAKRSREANLNYLRNSIRYLANRKTTVETIIESEKRRNKSSLNYFKFIQNNFDKIEMARNLYKVSIHKGKTPSEYTWLEWDKPLSKNLANRLLEKAKNNENLAKSSIIFKLENPENYVGNDIYGGLNLIFRSGKEASLFLLEAGIDGIKYPAESISRGATSDTARGFNYVVFDENVITIEEQIQFQKSGITPITNGFIYKNDVYLNKNADESTMVHEFNHLYNNWLKQNRSEVYKKGLDLIKEELKKKNSEIQDIIDFVKTNQPKLEGDALLEEIITEMVGRKGLELLNEQKDKAKSSGIIDYLKQVWQEIKNMLGLSSYTDEQILNMNLQDFANASAVDLLSGENIGRFSTDSNDIRFSQTIPTFKGNADIERIKKLNKKGNEDGATFNLDGSTYDKGGLIIPVISLNTTQKELSKELIEKFIQENSSKIGADNIKVGIFKFEDSNEVSIDLNVVVDAKYRDIGLTFGKYAGQESLFDLSTFLPAKTGADGKNPKNFTDEEFRDIANSLSEGKLPSFLNLSPQTSTNYANLTEDGEGNFVFYHVGGKGYDVIKRGTGQNTATSREEATAINRVGGVAMYYPAENVQESMFSGEAKYLVKVPQEKVYDFNRDTLNLLDEAEQMFRKQFPNQAFDKNSKLAFVTKIANEKGFDAVVANWDNTTRVQTTKELKPLDEQITEGNKIVKDFSAENKFKSNKDKGWQVVPTVMQSKLLKDVYDKIDTLVGNNFSNPLYRVREMAGYTFEDRFAPFKSQDEITDVVEKSDLPQEVKDEYNQAVNSKDKLGYSKLTKKPSLKIDIREVNGRLVVETLVNETKAGALRMLPYEDGYKVESVIVYDKYQNRRLGTRLYQEAIKFLLKSQTPLYSLKVRSENAKKIWDKFVEIGVAQKVGEDYIAPNKGGLDKNNEANPSDVMQYANTTDEKLSKEETAEAIDLTVSLGVESSQEAVAILKDTFLENNSFVFDKKKMKKSGFNDYEITKILVDVNLQNQIKNNLAKLENMDFSVPLMDVQTLPEIGIFGKQKVKPKVKTVNVKTVNEQGEVIDKVSDTKELLRKTYPDTLPTEIPQIISSLLKASESVVNKYNDLFYNTLDDLKDVALDLGVDLKDIENRVFPLENFKSFVNSLMNYYTNPSDAFAEVYDEFFENYGVEKATKPTISTPYTEYELFDKFNLVRNGDEYVKVEDVEIEPSAERQAKIPQLEVEDFAVDFDKLEKLVYHKEQLGVEMKTLQKPLVEEINLREVKKNPYLKATSEGVKLVSEDPLTAQKAELYGYEPKVAEKQPKKIETDYSLIQDVLVTQLTSENKVRTPKGNFTKFMDDNNKSVFLLDGSKQSTVDLEGYLSKADNTPKIEAKKLYSKEEYENNFGCLN